MTTTVPVGNAPRKIVVQPGPSAGGPIGQPAARGTTSPEPLAPALAPAPTMGDTASVSISKFAFAPATITITPGQVVTFTNSDPVAHTSTGAAGAWDSGEIAPGDTFATTLQQPGTYTYQCSIHPFMQATVVVQG